MYIRFGEWQSLFFGAVVYGSPHSRIYKSSFDPDYDLQTIHSR